MCLYGSLSQWCQWDKYVIKGEVGIDMHDFLVKKSD